MDKCIKVLIPTGEARMKEIGDTFHYLPDDERSVDVVCKMFDTPIQISAASSSDFNGEWVLFSSDIYEMYYPVIAQYGDEFPV